MGLSRVPIICEVGRVVLGVVRRLGFLADSEGLFLHQGSLGSVPSSFLLTELGNKDQGFFLGGGDK